MIEKVLRQVLQKKNQVGSQWITDPSSQVTANDIKYVFGSEGVYTNMFSGLNLEEELRIGGTKQTSYEMGQNFNVVEKYFLNSDRTIYYELKTSINNKVIRFLITGENEFIVQDTTENSPFLVFEDDKQDFDDNIIEIKLSKVINNTSTVIRTKKIFFNEEDGKKIISEVLY